MFGCDLASYCISTLNIHEDNKIIITIIITHITCGNNLHSHNLEICFNKVIEKNDFRQPRIYFLFPEDVKCMAFVLF